MQHTVCTSRPTTGCCDQVCFVHSKHVKLLTIPYRCNTSPDHATYAVYLPDIVSRRAANKLQPIRLHKFKRYALAHRHSRCSTDQQWKRVNFSDEKASWVQPSGNIRSSMPKTRRGTLCTKYSPDFRPHVRSNAPDRLTAVRAAYWGNAGY